MAMRADHAFLMQLEPEQESWGILAWKPDERVERIEEMKKMYKEFETKGDPKYWTEDITTRQVWEEVSGTGFYCVENEPYYVQGYKSVQGEK